MSATTVTSKPYGRGVVDGEETGWPRAGEMLLDELRSVRGRFALVHGASSATDQLAAALLVDLGAETLHLGMVLASAEHPPTASDLDRACGNAVVITDVDLLFWPEVPVDLIRFARTRAQRIPTILVWPGEIVGTRATYSAPGRPDFYETLLRDVLVLRPKPSRFPDEAPLTIERINP